MSTAKRKPIPPLKDRLRTVRMALGYGGHRQQSEFARLLGIKAPSLFYLESGRTRSVHKSLPGYLRLGANPEYILLGIGSPVLTRRPDA